jgi:predicted RNA-binding Zn-ribbon protein involved in translation (DUF1610 family)
MEKEMTHTLICPICGNYYYNYNCNHHIEDVIAAVNDARQERDEALAEIERLKVKLVMAERWHSFMNSAWGLDDDGYDDFGMENPPPTCAVCGSPLQAVRPGKWQCPKCG